MTVRGGLPDAPPLPGWLEGSTHLRYVTRMPFAETAAARIHYTVAGRGEIPLLLLMGLGGSAAEWGDEFVEALAGRFRMVLPDNRGVP